MKKKHFCELIYLADVFAQFNLQMRKITHNLSYYSQNAMLILALSLSQMEHLFLIYLQFLLHPGLRKKLFAQAEQCQDLMDMYTSETFYSS